MNKYDLMVGLLTDLGFKDPANYAIVAVKLDHKTKPVSVILPIESMYDLSLNSKRMSVLLYVDGKSMSRQMNHDDLYGFVVDLLEIVKKEKKR